MLYPALMSPLPSLAYLRPLGDDVIGTGKGTISGVLTLILEEDLQLRAGFMIEPLRKTNNEKIFNALTLMNLMMPLELFR